MSKELQVGDPAPDFKLMNAAGQEVSLSDFKGKKRVVLYFYPKDLTSGCTLEGQEFSGLKAEFEKLETVILGVSLDSMQSHQKFIREANLSVDLLSDTNSSTCQAYGLSKGLKGLLGLARSTFLIGKDGLIQQIYHNVKPLGHAQAVLAEIKSQP